MSERTIVGVLVRARPRVLVIRPDHARTTVTVRLTAMTRRNWLSEGGKPQLSVGRTVLVRAHRDLLGRLIADVVSYSS